MSDLNSPEKPSLGGSQPHSWSDVTLIEDITQESLSRRLSAQCLGEHIQSSSESEAEQPSPTEPPQQPIPSQIPAQAVCVVKRFRVRSRSRGPALPIAPASDSTQLGNAPGISDKPRPAAFIHGSTTQHRPACPRAPRSQASDTPLVGELNQEAQDALGPAAGHSEPTRRASGPEYHSLQAREACSQVSLHLHRGGLSTYWVSQSPSPDLSPVLPHGASFIGRLPYISQIR